MCKKQPCCSALKSLLKFNIKKDFTSCLFTKGYNLDQIIPVCVFLLFLISY